MEGRLMIYPGVSSLVLYAHHRFSRRDACRIPRDRVQYLISCSLLPSMECSHILYVHRIVLYILIASCGLNIHVTWPQTPVGMDKVGKVPMYLLGM